MKREEQDALLVEWQTRLGLHDWRIKFYPNCKPDEMSLEEAAGVSTYQEVNKTATIEIMDPKYSDDSVEAMDWEQVLVHELLHLKLCLIADKTDAMTERVGHILIDDLARAFVDAKRSGKKK